MEDYRLKQLIEAQLKYDKAKFRRADTQDDNEIARELQNQFNQETAMENPSNLVYDTKKKNIDSTKSLVDPSWELVDPTPNIHNLFMAFNQQYFWNKLLAVCVSWSKRMTSCAGICSYQPRAGMCSITLSEPLLKLRPRKDLVETLLHEMIHAFLFVTHNNRDRDGHGPEFHKHMYRINSEAGTNITVYHSFHDEVRLYQQYWWKCSGPCQYLRPYFGMVRRATNRAPGPNDRWWAEHSRSCGGTFIKVKEPEKKMKKKAEKENTKPKTTKLSNNASCPSVKNADIRNFFPVINDKTGPAGAILNQPKSYDNTNIQNIHGFKPGQNGSLELKNTSVSVIKPIVKLFNGSGNILSNNSSFSQPDYSLVRNSWLDKFDNQKNETVFKAPSTKRLKLNTVQCLNCNKTLLQEGLDTHLNTCSTTQVIPSNTAVASSSMLNLIECDICEEWIESSSIEGHKQMCIMNVSAQLDTTIYKECPVCNEPLCANLYDSHVASCVLKGMDNAMSKVPEEALACPVCKKIIQKSLLNAHLDECLTEEIFLNDDKQQNNIHNEQTIILDDNDDGSHEVESNSGVVYVNCPICQKEVVEQLINTHLDICLG